MLRRVGPRLFQWLAIDDASVSASPGAGQHIDNLPDLDEALTRARTAFAVSDEEGRRVLSGFSYVHAEAFPPDPYSEAYREAQMRLYAHISGREGYHARVNEQSEFDLAAARQRPFPYLTFSSEVVGTQLMAQGFAIRHLPLRPNSRVVEFGPGWGNLTLQLAQMGHAVTAVEIEPRFVELIRDRAARLGVAIQVIQQDMLEFQPEQPYDAAIFFESFHHCVDHLRMLHNLERIVAQDGLVMFAAEPISDFAHPWGIVRLDGLSLWSMRRFGWLELGFDTSYFLRTLLRQGWLPQRQRLAGCPGADVIVARRSQWLYQPQQLTLPPDEAHTWSEAGPDYRLAARRSVLSCARDASIDSVEFCLSNLGPWGVTVTLRAGDASEMLRLPPGVQRRQVSLTVKEWSGRVVIETHPSVFGLADMVWGDRVAVHHVRLHPKPI